MQGLYLSLVFVAIEVSLVSAVLQSELNIRYSHCKQGSLSFHYNTDLIIPDGNLRLADGPTSSEGRVEVFYSGTWGTVCDDEWDKYNGKVVCTQLGFPGVISVRNRAFYGRGSGPIWLDDVECNGQELSLSGCEHRSWGYHSCSSDHQEDAGVQCQRKFALVTLRTIKCVYFQIN